MLTLSWFEFIFRSIPEEFLFVLAVHVFSKTGIHLRRYLLSGILFSIIVFLIRLLPIQYGIHTILSLITLIILVGCINKIDIIKAIRAGIIVFILDFLLEGLNLLFIQVVLKVDLNKVVNNTILKTLTGLPSLLLFAIIITVYYIRISKRKELRCI